MTARQRDLMLTLEDKHFSEWVKTHIIVERECSDKQAVFCICGRIASSLHESHCAKFRDLVNRETVKRLQHLVKEE